MTITRVLAARGPSPLAASHLPTSHVHRISSRTNTPFSCASSQGALHTRAVAKAYGIPVILHTDHCQRSWLPWFDGLMDANEDYYKKNGEPLFSSHMLDLSEEPLEENVGTCVEYLTRMAKSDILLEMELGVTGGEEDGVDNSDVDSSKLYTQARTHATPCPCPPYPCPVSMPMSMCVW